MNKIGSALILAAVAFIPALPQNSKNPFVGRWDLAVTVGDMNFASWLEITERAGKLEARAQQRTGHAMPVAAIRQQGQRLLVTVMPAQPARPAEKGREAVPARPELVWELAEKGGRLSGVSRQGDTVWQLTGARAPALKRAAPAEWGPPEPLFNGKDLTGWQPINNTPGLAQSRPPSRWTVRNGELVNEGHGPNLRTTRTFDDFKLHLEYAAGPAATAGSSCAAATRHRSARLRIPRRRRPRGELRAARLPAIPQPVRLRRVHLRHAGARLAAAVPAGMASVRPHAGGANGDGGLQRRHHGGEREIAGVTGGAIDSNEGEPGPDLPAGDHEGRMRYRNITISLPKR